MVELAALEASTRLNAPAPKILPGPAERFKVAKDSRRLRSVAFNTFTRLLDLWRVKRRSSVRSASSLPRALIPSLAKPRACVPLDNIFPVLLIRSNVLLPTCRFISGDARIVVSALSNRDTNPTNTPATNYWAGRFQ